MRNSLPKVPLGELLQRSNEILPIEPEKDYREITVKLWGKGVVLRGKVPGVSIAAARRFVARKDQFILSRI
jgi:type I restriction enzyme S subunit